MEIDITEFLTANHFDFSASQAERGVNAGPETWRNALDHAGESPLVSAPDDIEYLRNWFGEFGAWDAKERAGWTPNEINALLVQYISGDIREAQALCAGDGPGEIDWPEYEALAQAGTIGGNMFLSGESVFFYAGS